ncbi:unnamed protein product [Nyctereutes procyonoides]|uniref:(raccoon dog) hypothetical protein n=1 Tax=Nyctereutes procyonoides TaxID=34880 RepID=A0A811YVJ1_NYCPR|nr:unnamed protein product [Nyctereutes procyonoides]CAD7688290.1 unnamed protein product [Nyctereutes procyonoides]
MAESIQLQFPFYVLLPVILFNVWLVQCLILICMLFLIFR